MTSMTAQTLHLLKTELAGERLPFAEPGLKGRTRLPRAGSSRTGLRRWR